MAISRATYDLNSGFIMVVIQAMTLKWGSLNDPTGLGHTNTELLNSN